MLTLTNKPKRIDWTEAGVWLDLIPLAEDVDQQITEQTTEIERDPDTGRIIRITRDTARYAQLAGKHCIKDWGGVADDAQQPIKCTAAAIDVFMLIRPAQDFIINKIKSLDMYLQQEKDAAKND